MPQAITHPKCDRVKSRLTWQSFDPGREAQNIYYSTHTTHVVQSGRCNKRDHVIPFDAESRSASMKLYPLFMCCEPLLRFVRLIFII